MAGIFSRGASRVLGATVELHSSGRRRIAIVTVVITALAILKDYPTRFGITAVITNIRVMPAALIKTPASATRIEIPSRRSRTEIVQA